MEKKKEKKSTPEPQTGTSSSQADEAPMGQTAMQPAPPVPPPTIMAEAGRGLQLTTMDEMWRFSKAVLAAGVAPKDWNQEMAFIAIQMGAEAGLAPMQAIQNIAVINGRPSIWGDAAIGLVQASGFLEYKTERFEGEGTSLRAICEMKRKGHPEPCVRTFSVEDAKTAKLWGKQGPWTQYPKRMLQMRARSWALRDEFADCLKGLHIREESADIEPIPETPRATVRVIPGPAESHTTPGERIAPAPPNDPIADRDAKFFDGSDQMDDPDEIAAYETIIEDLKGLNSLSGLQDAAEDIEAHTRLSADVKKALIASSMDLPHPPVT